MLQLISLSFMWEKVRIIFRFTTEEMRKFKFQKTVTKPLLQAFQGKLLELN